MPDSSSKSVLKTVISTAVSLFLVSGVLIFSCSWFSRKNITEQNYKERGEVVVATVNSPTTYFENSSGLISGMEYDLTQEFALDFGVRIKYLLVDGVEDALEALERKTAHLAAAGLTLSNEREEKYLLGPSYMSVSEDVICHRRIKVHLLKDLTKTKLVIVNSSSYRSSLEEVKRKIPTLTWFESKELDLEEIFEKIQQREIDCTVSDSTLFNVNRRHFSSLRRKWVLSKKERIGWILGKDQYSLQKDVETWFRQMKRTGELRNISDRYFGASSVFDEYDFKIFQKRVVEVLPKYRAWFVEAGEKYSLDWKLLAAVGYQESHWNPNTESVTGVRGLMMLTKITAAEVGVLNREDARESIFGGAKYLRKLLNRVPSYIAADERLWFALAAYNVGAFHLQDARKLAIELNRNPNRWADVRAVLPLLSQPRYYKSLKHGYARGREPVKYVAHIRQYYSYLKSLMAL